MEKIIAMLIMLLPGFVVRWFQCETITLKEIKSDWEKTIISLGYSVPILISNIFWYRFRWGINSINEIVDKLNNIDFIMSYIFSTVMFTILFWGILTLMHPKVTNIIINKIRGWKGENKKTIHSTPWEDFFAIDEDIQNRPMEVIKDNKTIGKGILRNWDLTGTSDKDLVLEFCDEMECNKECFESTRRVYVDYKNNTIIKEYYFDETKLDDDSK